MRSIRDLLVDLPVFAGLGDAALEEMAGCGRLVRFSDGELLERAGAPADVCVLDLAAKWRVDPARFHSKSRNTPFAGRELTGAVALTIVGGVTVHDRAAE